MNLRRCVVPVLIAGWLAYALVAGRSGSASQREAEPASNPPDPGTEVVTQTEVVTEENQTPTELAQLEVEYNKRERAAEKMQQSRKSLWLGASAAWSDMLRDHRQAFESLRQKAAASPHGQTLCTLCDGTGHMNFCLLCGDSGKCRMCGGTGMAARDEYCPSCLGKGTCYFCFGSKGMTCPFCDDGTVDVKGPVPRGLLPIK